MLSSLVLSCLLRMSTAQTIVYSPLLVRVLRTLPSFVMVSQSRLNKPKKYSNTLAVVPCGCGTCKHCLLGYQSSDSAWKRMFWFPRSHK